MARLVNVAGRAFVSADEVGEGHVEGVSDEEQMVQQGGVGALLDPVDGLAVEAHELTEFLLAESLSPASCPDGISDGPAAGEYPVGQRIRWHAYTLVNVLINVCTIVGTSRARR